MSGRISGRVLPMRREGAPSPEEWRRVERELRRRIRIYRAKQWASNSWPAIFVALSGAMLIWELFL